MSRGRIIAIRRRVISLHQMSGLARPDLYILRAQTALVHLYVLPRMPARIANKHFTSRPCSVWVDFMTGNHLSIANVARVSYISAGVVWSVLQHASSREYLLNEGLHDCSEVGDCFAFTARESNRSCLPIPLRRRWNLGYANKLIN